MYNILFQDNKKLLFTISPTKRTLMYNNKFYYLSLPEIVFSIKFENKIQIKCGFLFDNKVFHLPLPNISGYNICVGDEIGKTLLENSKLENFISAFWQTSFNNDFSTNIQIISYVLLRKNNEYNLSNSIVYFLDNWQLKTKQNKNWIPSIDYLCSKNTFGINLKDF